jgi:hypothetical protein
MTTKVTITNEGPEALLVSNVTDNPGGTSSGLVLMPGHSIDYHVWQGMHVTIYEALPAKTA